MDSHCEIMWGDNSVAGLGCHPTADYGSAADNSENQALICQHLLRSNMISMCINNSLTTDAKLKLRAYNISYD